MAQADWLASYAQVESIHAALDRMSLRLKRENRLAGAGAELEANYAALEADFRAFFPDLVRFDKRSRGRKPQRTQRAQSQHLLRNRALDALIADHSGKGDGDGASTSGHSWRIRRDRGASPRAQRIALLFSPGHRHATTLRLAGKIRETLIFRPLLEPKAKQEQ